MSEGSDGIKTKREKNTRLTVTNVESLDVMEDVKILKYKSKRQI